MASEIRVLEDQLYDADYQNRVLRDKLAQCEPCEEAAKVPTSSADTPLAPSPGSPKDTRTQDTKTKESSDMDDGFELDDDLALPTLDEGEPVDPDALTDPGGPTLDDNMNDEEFFELPAPLPPARRPGTTQ